MSNQMTAEQKVKLLELASADLDRQFGSNSVYRIGEDAVIDWPAVSTGALSLDVILGIGGLPLGRIVEIFGPESCLDGDTTFVQYEIRTKDGKRQNHKGGTLRRLYNRFHGIPESGSGNYLRPQTKDSEYFLSSVNEEGRIFQNRITDVVSTGVKPCFSLKTDSGEEIIGTADHKFFIGDHYVRLGDLKVGDTVFIHNNTHFQKEHVDSIYRKEVYVKNHPVAPTRLIEGKYQYHRLPLSKAVVEANMNGMELEVYKKNLDAGYTDGMVFLESHLHVHHKDEDARNNHIDNLVVIDPRDHGRLHAVERHNNLRFIVVPTTVASIEPVGDRETFDIKMLSPYNNFVANNFVVHNSGKSTICLEVVAQAQRMGGNAVFIDAEHSVDPKYAQALGVNMDDLWFSQPDYGEQALEIATQLVKTGAVDVMVIDSVAALTPKAELEGTMEDQQMGLQARMMSKAMRRLAGYANKNNTLIIFTNQLREKIGIMFGNPEVTPGGRALKFAASVRIDLRRKEEIKDKLTGQVLGIRVEAKTPKNKMAPALKRTMFDIIYGEGVDTEGCIVDLATEHGVLVKSGAWFKYKGESLSQGRPNAVALLKENKELADTMLEEVKEIIKPAKKEAVLPEIDDPEDDLEDFMIPAEVLDRIGNEINDDNN